jgi:alkanesulfonate monooxygenase SsuD/methylene tetrahydromethanopterin reductase-like flavin-dependent oxidoreductase (luciferase family)
VVHEHVEAEPVSVEAQGQVGVVDDERGVVEWSRQSDAKVASEAMWFGLFLPQLRMSFDTIVERALAAETAGFDSIWLMDHLAAPGAMDQDTFEGWTLAAALAARTTTVRIGHLVTCDPFRHPAVLAKMAATVDVLSGGRLELGLGWGSVEEELHRFGVAAGGPARRAARLRETLEILDLMFTGESFDYAGDQVQLEGAIGRPVPAQAHIPVHLGGAGPKLTMPLVRDHADWWNCPSYGVERLAELRPQAGRARISVQHPVGLVVDESAREAVETQAQRRFGSWGGLLVGTADELVEALIREVDLGAEGFVLQFSDFGTPATVEHFMETVAPAVRAHPVGH